MTRFIADYADAATVADLAEFEDAIVMAGVTATSTEGYGIAANGGPHRIGVFGALGASFNAIFVSNGNGTRIKTGATGKAVGNLDGVLVYGSDTRLENHGEIVSLAGRGVALSAPVITTAIPTTGGAAPDPAFVRNFGTISGETGIGASGVAVKIVNAGLIAGLDRYAIQTDAGSDFVKNLGVLHGDVSLGEQSDVLYNRGTIYGDVFGGAGADVVDNRSGAVDGTFDLGEGADSFVGGATDEIVLGGDSADTLDGRGGNDTLTGGLGKDTLLGGDGDDTLSGEGGADVLKGGAGDDILNGGTTGDQLTGGAGADRFFYDKFGLGAGDPDKILDFSRAEGDRIDLSKIDAVKSTAFDEPFKFIGTQLFHNVAGELRIDTSGGYNIVLGDTDGNGSPDIAIFVYTAVNLAAEDFVL